MIDRKLKNTRIRPLLISLLMLFVALIFISAQSGSAEPSDGLEPTKWSVSLPSGLCPGGAHYDCHGGSPVLADITGDGRLDVVTVTNIGFIVAIRNDGAVLWQRDIAPYFGMAPLTHEIHSSPAVGDVDNDGFPEIAVGAGTIRTQKCTQGGVILFDHNGNVKPGWPQLTYDVNVPPADCADSVIASPSLGDLDNDGDLEIVASGFDKRVYAWHHDGTLVSGYPPDSFHADRFPTWPNLRNMLADDVWSSPALADLDRDGYLDVVTATGEGNFDQRYGGDSNGWTCPYASPPLNGSPGYCGGSLYAFNRFGELLPGFPRYFLESMVSSIAVADVNEDGDYEIFAGFSDYYFTLSPDHPTYGFRLLGLDRYANDLPGWEGGKAMGGVSMMSPAIGDIAGDDGLEIVTLGADRKLYAWHANGTPVAGFPMTPLDTTGGTSAGFRSYTGIALADYDGDEKMEVFFNQGWAVTIVDGNGQQLTGTDYPNNNEAIYYGYGMLVNTPAIGDIDGDGKLELVATNSMARAWDLDDSTDKADWPMFRGNPTHHARLSREAFVAASPAPLTIHHDIDSSGSIQGSLSIYPPRGGAIDWNASASGLLSLSTSSGTALPFAPSLVVVTVHDSGFNNGMHYVGEINLEAAALGEDTEPVYASVPVTVYIGDFELIYLPITSK